jgi:acyl carrier protein
MVDLERKVKEIIASVWQESKPDASSGWEDIGNEVPLYSIADDEESLGLDSLDALEISMEIEEAFDVVLPTEVEPADIRTVNKVIALLERLLIEQREPE